VTARSKLGRRLLGKTGRKVSELGFGCGGLWASRMMPDQRAIDLVHHAIDLGFTCFTTTTGEAGGLAQDRLGRALRSHRHRIDGLTITANVGTVRARSVGAGRWGVLKDFSPLGIEAQLLESLERLGLDQIPILVLDDPDPIHLTEDLAATLAEHKRGGLIGLVGISGSPARIQAALTFELIDVILPTYSPIDRSADTVIGLANGMGLGVIATGVLSRMAFSTEPKWAGSDPATWTYAARRLADRVTAADQVARARKFLLMSRVKDWTAAQACLGVVLANPNIHCGVFRSIQPDHLTENAATSGRALLPSVLAKLRSLG
jgi:aryl-alcohol dehydrogenase-like predicted oxidoreductase